MGGLRESYALVVVWITYMGISSAFLLANHLALPGSESIFGLSQGPPMCVCTSLSQVGFYWRGLWVGWHHLWWGEAPSLLISKQHFCTCGVRKVSLPSRMRNMWSPLGMAQLLFLFILEYLSTGDKLQLLNLGYIFLVPQNHTVNDLVSEKPKLKLRQVWFLGTHTHKKFSSCTFQSSRVVLFFFFF